MKTKHLLLIAACSGLVSSCAAVVPRELVDARDAYKRASDGQAARVAPAELHVAHEALARAERAFREHDGGFQTRDLAYVAHRKAQLAEAAAAITVAQQGQARASNDFQQTQGQIVDSTRQDLSASRTALAASQRSGDVTEAQLSAEQSARVDAETRTTEAETARAAADQRAATAQAALASLAAVKDEPRGMVITLSGSVLFASGQATLLHEAQAKLNQVADVLLATRERNVTVEGYTDSKGSDSSNVDLSQRRADAVRNYLVQRGYEGDLIQARGLGEAQPIADNASAEGRANNRRVQIVIEREAHTSHP